MTKAASVKPEETAVEATPEETQVPPVTLLNWAPPAIIPDEDGYYCDSDWVRIECDWDGLKPREGFKPLWAEFDASLTFAEAQAIPVPFGTSFVALAPHVCHRVRAWNARKLDPETGQVSPAPAPAEAGLAAFDHVNKNIMAWIAFTLKTIHLQGGPNRKLETNG